MITPKWLGLIGRYRHYLIACVAAALTVVGLLALARGLLLGAGPPPSPSVEITRRLTSMQDEIDRLKAERSFEVTALEKLVPRLAQGVTEAVRNPAAEPKEVSAPAPAPPLQEQQRANTRPVAVARMDEIESRLAALLRYVNEVERSISKIDASTSTPGVLEKAVERHKALTRP